MIDVKVLGPLDAQVNGLSIAPTAGKPRQLLALLALEAGQVVIVPTLIEELWGTRPPRSALTTLQTYVLHLRRLIDAALAGSNGTTSAGSNGNGAVNGNAVNGNGNGSHPNGGHPAASHPNGGHPAASHPNGGHPAASHPNGGHPNGHPAGSHPNGGGPRAAKDVLVTRTGGYLLDIHAGSVDVQSYELLAADGLRAAGAGDFEAASRQLRAALAVWRGPALADVQAGLRLGIEVIRLEESKLSTLEACIDAELRLGRHYTLLSELAKLNASYPMHENLCAQFMLALYRSGQQWRALDVYKRLRDTLVDELGVEPSAPLQHLHRAILRSDPVLSEIPARGVVQERLAI